MGIKTELITLGSEWVKVTDGSQTRSLQVLSGIVSMVDADSVPPGSATGHVITGWVGLTQPTTAWVRSATESGAVIAIS